MALVVACAFTACQTRSGHSEQQEQHRIQQSDSLTQKLQEANAEGEVVGFSVAIINPDEVLYQKGFGFRNAKDSSAYQANTVQNIGSVAKTVLGIALLRAQEMGKLQIDDPIADYLPFDVINPHHPDQPITIRHLATHSSSIVDYTENYLKAFILEQDSINKKEEVAFSHFQKPDQRISLFDFLEACLSKEGAWYAPEMFSEQAPGSTFEYSNFGADLCALIIEQATGMPYSEFTVAQIFEPLGMHDSGWAIADLDPSKRSNFYLFKGQKIADYTAITYPNGCLFTSSSDLGKFLAELMKGYSQGGQLLSKSSYAEFYKKQYARPLNQTGRVNVGIFNEYNTDFIGSTELLIGHNGSDFGSFALLYFNPESQIGTIVMANTDIDYKDDTVVPVIKSIWKAVLDHKDGFELEATP